MQSRYIGPSGPVDAQGIPISHVASATQNQDSSAFGRLVAANQTAAASQTQGITVSAHARDRLRSRNITLGDTDLQKIATAMDKMAEKGARQSLFLVKTSGGQDAAMVVSIRNRVVITAVDGESMRDNLFTNIDSAAILS